MASCSVLDTAWAQPLASSSMGDRSPKATQKQAAQKQSKAGADKQKKAQAVAAKHVPEVKKTKK